MSRFKRHPVLTLAGIFVLTLVALVAFRLVSSGAKKDPRKERVNRTSRSTSSRGWTVTSPRSMWTRVTM